MNERMNVSINEWIQEWMGFLYSNGDASLWVMGWHFGFAPKMTNDKTEWNIFVSGIVIRNCSGAHDSYGCIDIETNVRLCTCHGDLCNDDNIFSPTTPTIPTTQCTVAPCSYGTSRHLASLNKVALTVCFVMSLFSFVFIR